MGENDYRQKAFSHLATYKKHKKKSIPQWQMEVVFREVFDLCVKEWCEPRPKEKEIHKKLEKVYEAEKSLEEALREAIKIPDMGLETIYKRYTGADIYNVFDEVGVRNRARAIRNEQDEKHIEDQDQNKIPFSKWQALYKATDTELNEITIHRLGDYYTWLTGKSATRGTYNYLNDDYTKQEFLDFVEPIWKALFSIVKDKGIVTKVNTARYELQKLNEKPKEVRGNSFVTWLVDPNNNYLAQLKP
jgi:hypothetical protein